MLIFKTPAILLVIFSLEILISSSCSIGKKHADEMDFWTKEEFALFIKEVMNKSFSYETFNLLYLPDFLAEDIKLLFSRLYDQGGEERIFKFTKGFIYKAMI